jgi:hypothetical protein
MKQVNQSLNRRRFLKGLGVATAGVLTIPTLLKTSVTAQEFTQVSVYARMAGAPRPDIALTEFGTDAWICLGDEVELYWVTTPDVNQIDLGDDLGVFAADQGGNENGLNWGSTMVQPSSKISYQIEALDGDFEAASDASVLVFGRPTGEGPFFVIDEGQFSARRTTGATNTRDSNEWAVELSPDRFSPRLGMTFIKPIGQAASGVSQAWNVLKTDADGTEHRFALAQRASYQNPFTPAGTDVTVPVGGSWVFTTRSDIVTSRDITFMVKAVCAEA